ncbi:hypothetical protein P7K49_018602 [Saguinus oedipus]|uniref:Uncharacterized protein n=1 Tax=Saguinus oedipus TaxID=9490 RepID=A0ABQ9V679_SAGOE|nr:hypothetical protein P7K49_018602 [Saguinus oedipus]
MSPGLLLLASAVLLAFGLCCTFVHRARSRYEHIPGPPRPRPGVRPRLVRAAAGRRRPGEGR